VSKAWLESIEARNLETVSRLEEDFPVSLNFFKTHINQVENQVL
jgi:hypothetical protein